MNSAKICKLCKENSSNLSKSHIFPKGFLLIDGNREYIEAYTDADCSRKLRIGLYDNEILCPKCEEKIATYDDYAISVLRDKKNSYELYPQNKERFIIFDKLDYRKLRGFFASLLLRISFSSQKEISSLSVGEKYEKLISNDILVQGNFAYIDALICFLSDEEHRSFLMPRREKFNPQVKNRGIANGWRVYLPNMMLLIKLDQREHPFTLFMQDGEKRISTSLAYFEKGYKTLLVPQYVSFEDVINNISNICKNEKRKDGQIILLPHSDNQSVFRISHSKLS